MKQRKQDHHKEQDSSEQEVSIDFSGVKNFFKNVNMDILVAAVFILFAMVLVFSVRMLPASLPITDSWAQSTLQQNLRNQVAAQVDQQFPALPDTNRNSLIDRKVAEVVAANQADFNTAQAQLSNQFKEQLRYNANGGEYTYLGDLDSYFWLRYARNLVRNGTACDEIVNGECRDNYVLAPQGSPMNPSFHVYAIFVLYKIITIFSPDYPLPAASFLLQALLGVVLVIPAFFVGRRLAGNVGGLFSAVLVSMHPLLLSRTLGSDNDQWSFIFPLFLLWMIIEALEAKDTKRRIIFAVLAAAAVALHSKAWDAYWFNYLIVLFGLLAYMIFVLVRSAYYSKKDFWKTAEVKHTALIIGVFYLACFFLLIFTGHQQGYFSLPITAAGQGAALDRAIVADYWPNVLTTVAELNKSNFGDAINQMGGKWFFFISLAGLLLMLLPLTRWKLQHYLAFVGGAIICLYLVNAPGLSRLVTLALLAIPVGAILLLNLFTKEKEEMHIAPALIVLVWFLASVYATYSGVRFILLLIPAFSITFAITAGRTYLWVSEFLSKEIKWHRYITNVIVFAIVALLLVLPVKSGESVASNYIPSIDDAWWNSLTKINRESAPDAVINSWWDFGHWFKYVADRRVTADGTTQGTHAPRWLGLALVTPDEREAVGTLRMLVCGNDAFPSVEGEDGAYGMILKKVQDSVNAQQMLRDIILLDRAQASAYLTNHGFTADERERILNASHCNPPEDYLITSNDMIGKAGVWAHFGLWNFTKAYVAGYSRNQPQAEAVADLQQRFGFSAEEAEQLYYDAKALSNEGEFNQFAAPWPGYVTGSWVPCSQSPNSTMLSCQLNLGISQSGGRVTAIDSFTYNVSDVNSSMITYGFYQNGQRIGVSNGSPQVLILALADRMETITPPNSTGSFAIILDVPNKRMLMTDPLLAKSQFTQLYYLDGRYSQYFDKFDEQNGFSGTRVVVWKVDWDGKPKPNATSSTVVIGSRNSTRTNVTA